MRGQGQNNGVHILIVLPLFIIGSGRPRIVIIGGSVMTYFLNFVSDCV